LFLSQYLPNQAALAKSLSLVTGIWNYPSYSGYFTVRPQTGSNLYFWYFPAQNGKQNAPLLLWLNGGPGSSSLYGLFQELGPFSVTADAKATVPRNITWNQNYHLIFVDNPVGVGFSFTTSPAGYAQGEDVVQEDMYSLLTQFFQVFPELQPCDFYVTGESYAGKYVPAIAAYIQTKNTQSPKIFINLKGVSIGDGMMDPLTQIPGYGTLLYSLGLADDVETQTFVKYENMIVTYINQQRYEDAFWVFDAMLNGDFYPFPTYFTNITGLTNYFNFLDPDYPPNPFEDFLNQNSTRNALHVGMNAYWSYNATVESYFLSDWMQSVRPYVTGLLNTPGFKVLIYNGQNDIILSAPNCENFISTINWSGAQDFESAPKKLWYYNNSATPVGYARQTKTFTYVVVRDAGHLLPQDQPGPAFDMITRFVDNISY
jgi:vitellogenic carboxypeptidase-like protein